jgi:hypothetical protein
VSVLGRATAEGRLKQARAERDAAEHRLLAAMAALNAALDRGRQCPCWDQCPGQDGLLSVGAALTRGGGRA